jgi:type II secretory pathway pseudopilin PulG
LSAFSLIELTMVVLIVAILAAVFAPMIRPGIDAAKWTEGRAGAGLLATGIRAYCVETGHGHPEIPAPGNFSDFQVFTIDLRGKYFTPANYSVSEVIYDEDSGSMSYLITVTAPAGVSRPDMTLNQNGQWSDGK